eukprot:1140840-Pelagomonas_calceolata.AAC.1
MLMGQRYPTAPEDGSMTFRPKPGFVPVPELEQILRHCPSAESFVNVRKFAQLACMKLRQACCLFAMRKMNAFATICSCLLWKQGFTLGDADCDEIVRAAQVRTVMLTSHLMPEFLCKYQLARQANPVQAC